MNDTGPYSKYVTIGSGNRLVPSEANVGPDLRRHMVSLGNDELTYSNSSIVQ